MLPAQVSDGETHLQIPCQPSGVAEQTQTHSATPEGLPPKDRRRCLLPLSGKLTNLTGRK